MGGGTASQLSAGEVFPAARVRAAFRHREHGFVGRGAELGRLSQALDAAAAGQPRVVIVCGEAGVGKTRLLSEFCSRVTASWVLQGGCVELGAGDLPYAPIVGALRHLPEAAAWDRTRTALGPSLEAIARLVPSIRDRVSPDGVPPLGVEGTELGRAQFFELILGALDRLGRVAPVVLILEDLHWADQSTLDLLVFLARNLRAERLLLVVTVRTDGLPRRHHVRTVLAGLSSQGAERMELAGFTRTELGALAAGMLGRPPDGPFLDRLAHRSEGNAFFAEELLATGDIHPSRPPASLRDVVLARVDTLGSDVRSVLHAAAVVGRPVDEELLATVSGLSPDRVAAALRGAVDEGVMLSDEDATHRLGGSGHRFRHSIAQEAVYEELLAGERRRLHAAVAGVISARAPGGPTDAAAAAELAQHWYAAGDAARAIATAVQAGRLAIRISAYAEARRLLDRALELSDREPALLAVAGLRRGELLELAAEAARWVGDLPRATALCRRSVAEVDARRDPVLAGVLQERLGRYLWEVGDSPGSLAAYERAVELMADQPVSAAQVRTIASHAAALMLTSRYRESCDRAREAIELARGVDAVVEESHALATLGVDLSMLGDMAGGEAALRRALALAVDADSMEDICRAYTNLSSVLEVAGRLEEAAEVALQGFGVARAKGLELTGGGIMVGNAAEALLKLGRWSEVDTILRDLLPRLTGLMQAYMGQIQVALSLSRGDLEAAEQQFADATRKSKHVTEPQLIGPHFALRTELAIERQDLVDAIGAVEEGTRALADSEDRHFVIRLCALGLRALANDVERPGGHRPAAQDAEARRHVDVARLLALARRSLDHLGADGALVAEASIDMLECEGEFSRCMGSPDPDLWSSAADSWERLAQPLRSAYARLRAAEACLDRRDMRRAADELRRGHELAAELGANRLVADLVALARRTRLTLTAPAPPRPAPDPFHLTPREHEVLRHLVQGLSNRQIARALAISEKTASVHVSNILTKLGATSRTQAAAFAHQLQLVDGAGPGQRSARPSRSGVPPRVDRTG